MIRRNRPKQVVVQDVRILTVFFSGIVQVGDLLGDATPFSYGEAYGGYRGAPSFLTEETAKPINTRLHYANQLDEDINDSNILGDQIVTFRPNIFGRGGR